jgi:predicted DNA-binding transcriptional regulator YafY
MDYPTSDVYEVVDRLTRLRDLLRAGPQTMQGILARMERDYRLGESGKRQVRRDLRNLELMGYQIERLSQPLRWALMGGQHMLSDADVDALVYVREMFSSGHPLSPTIHRVLTRLTHHLPEPQRSRWQRRPALRVRQTPAIDYSTCDELLPWLDVAITERAQIQFLYRSRSDGEVIRHARLDPYDIEYTDRHFYLIAFSYQLGNVRMFRLDRIVQDRAQRSPERLPSRQPPRHERRPIHFSYRLPASFADGGVSERFTTHAVRQEGDFVIVEASDPSEFRIIRTLLGYGEHAVLLDGPPSLMQRMRQTVAQMAANYGYAQ